MTHRRTAPRGLPRGSPPPPPPRSIPFRPPMQSQHTITCHICGCLNFSAGDVCDTCQQQRKTASAAATTANGRGNVNTLPMGRQPAVAIPGGAHGIQVGNQTPSPYGSTLPQVQRPQPPSMGRYTDQVRNNSNDSSNINIHNRSSRDSNSGGGKTNNSSGGSNGSSQRAPAAAKGPTVNRKRPRVEKQYVVIDLISSDDDNNEDDITKKATDEAKQKLSVGKDKAIRPPIIEKRSTPPPPPPAPTPSRTSTKSSVHPAPRVKIRPTAVPERRVSAAVQAENTVQLSQSTRTDRPDTSSPFLGRLFPDVPFAASDFPSVETSKGKRPTVNSVTGPSASSVAAPAVSSSQSQLPVQPSSQSAQSVPAQAPSSVPSKAAASHTAQTTASSLTKAPNPLPVVAVQLPLPDQAILPPSMASRSTVRSPHNVAETSRTEVLEDEEDSSQTQGPLFQSRRFVSAVFNPLDFHITYESAQLARRSSNTQLSINPNHTTGSEKNGNKAESIAEQPSARQAPSDKESSHSSSEQTQLPPIPSAPAVDIATYASSNAVNATRTEINILQARKKNTTKAVATRSSMDSPTIKTEPVAPSNKERLPRMLTKPTKLGECSLSFLMFMRDCGDDDDTIEDDEETHRMQLQLLGVVDLTNLSDSDEDDSDDDDFSNAPTSVNSTTTRENSFLNDAPGVEVSQVTMGVDHLGRPMIIAAATINSTENAKKVGPQVKPRRQVQMEMCVLCEAKRWIKTLIHCETCGKYYHKKCAKDYGDESICWNCQLDGMIDDSELDEATREQVTYMLSTLHYSPIEEEPGENDAEEDATKDENGQTEHSGEEKQSVGDDVDVKTQYGGHNPLLAGATTKSMQRWKAFLDQSTAHIDASFYETTKRITEELQTEEGRAKYSKGFATREGFEAAMSEVLDSYADLQDQLDREAREEKARNQSTANANNGNERSTDASATVDGVNGGSDPSGAVAAQSSDIHETVQDMPTDSHSSTHFAAAELHPIVDTKSPLTTVGDDNKIK